MKELLHSLEAMADNTDSSETGETETPAKQCYCPIGGLMDLLSRKHAMAVICAVGTLQPVRYGELEAAFGDVSSSTLSVRLEELTDAGLLERKQYDEIPPRVEYRLTADGGQLCELLNPILEWVAAREN